MKKDAFCQHNERCLHCKKLARKNTILTKRNLGLKKAVKDTNMIIRKLEKGNDSRSVNIVKNSRGGDFVVKRVGMTVRNLKKYPKKYQAVNFANPKRYHLE